MKTITSEDINLDGIEVIFEITRICNMECPHCIRGDKQRIRIKKEYIDQVFSKIDYIGTLVLSGGEPALATDLMGYVLHSMRRKRVGINNFWMATNGSIVTKRFFDLLYDFYEYADDNEISGLRVSIDNYHDYIDGNNKWHFRDFEERIQCYLGINHFNIEFQGAPDNPRNLIMDGRAKDNYYSDREVSHEIYLAPEGYIEGSLYINAKGFINTSCDLSYETMKDKDFVICHVNDDIKYHLAEWFNAHPEHIYEN